MKALITGIKLRTSKYGGTFKHIFFKSLETGKSYKTCVADKFSNSIRWRSVAPGMVLENLVTKGELVDADSVFLIHKGDKNV